MNETVGNLFVQAINELETEVQKRGECCGCGKGDVEDRIDHLRTLVEAYSDGPKRPGY